MINISNTLGMDRGQVEFKGMQTGAPTSIAA
jgi:hypothetical protein